jgi:hypothetical protein
MQLNSPEDWWNAVDANWSNLLEIVYHHMDMDHAAYEVPGDAKSAPTGRTIDEELTFLKKNRDQRLARYLSASWFMASEAYCWSVPGWGTMCDLLSEEQVCFDEEE